MQSKLKRNKVLSSKRMASEIPTSVRSLAHGADFSTVSTGALVICGLALLVKRIFTGAARGKRLTPTVPTTLVTRAFLHIVCCEK